MAYTRKNKEPGPNNYSDAEQRQQFFDPAQNPSSFFSKPAVQRQPAAGSGQNGQQHIEPVKVAQVAPASFIANAPLNTKQKADEDKVKKMVPKAISLLGKAVNFLAEGSQQELLQVMLSQFNSVKSENIGSLDANGGRLIIGTPMKLGYTFQYPGAMSKPFEYSVRIDVSHETETSAGGYFHATGNYGGNIVVVIDKAKLVSEEGIANLLTHEAVHMFSHLQRSVSERIGATEASVIPGTKAAKILDVSSFGPFKKKFTRHFNAVKDFLNSQPHRKDAFNQIPDSTIDDWNRKVIEETIAYVYETRISTAVMHAKMRADKRKGAKVGVAIGFVPLEFLKRYMTDFWLTDKDDVKAMGTEKGHQLLGDMSEDMIALHQAVEAQVGPDKEMP